MNLSTSFESTWRSTPMKANRSFTANPSLAWRKSSYSGSENGACVEVADGIPHVIPVRDSKNLTAPALAFPAAQWQQFVTAAKNSAFND
ncbi:DUF397 domain-containing protein [Streptomyces litchfieldiae]|uniref:DUF397 domain-containing protein n=1 Tax=Streptomyces litchfieldiae TaxID=3075543 RepID=A0ABU2MM65_9ACTN|nr:DUF397 domain-containing protein [Streptomyces sp. DSM 44938]MDT0342695.1 DUF397 domain-containing protein [Streptomyces sp. DSM 44938]